MFQLLILALLLQQGPKDLQVGEHATIKPPVIVPKGTAIEVALINSISTKTAKDGDPVYARTVFPVTIGNDIVIPVGSHIRGKITEVARPGRVKGKAELTLSFQSLILPSGITVELLGTLGNVGATGKKKGETGIEGDSGKGEDAATIGESTGTGALAGAVISRSAKGAGIGAAAGGAVGAARVLLTRGKELVLRPGTTMEIILDRPLEP
jgi:hypothetical protein